MNRQLRLRDGKIKTAYWSLVGVVSALLVSTQAVFAADMWDRFSMIMKDIYGELVAISTIVAVTVAAIALLVRMISRNQRAVDEATSWLKRIVITWISSVVSDMMDAVSGLFLQALGTDMTAMEEYFPFVSKAFTVMQYTAWALLFLITVWQLFRVFGGPVTEAENPWVLLGRSALFAFLIGYAKPIFLLTLKIATAPYTALMDIQMTAEDFTFAGIEQALQNGLTSLIDTISVVGLLLLTILEIALGWNYFKLLLETVERYIVVGVLC